MNDSSSVLMTSLVPTLALSTPAIAPQTPPASDRGEHRHARTTSGIGSAARAAVEATAVAAMPPTAIWPSPPTLVRLARCAMTKPRPTRRERERAVDRGADRIGRAPGAVGEGGERLRHRDADGRRPAAMPHSSGGDAPRRSTTSIAGRSRTRWRSRVAAPATALMRSCPAIMAPMRSRCAGSAAQWPMMRPR